MSHSVNRIPETDYVQDISVDYDKHAHGKYLVYEDGDKLSLGSHESHSSDRSLKDILGLFNSIDAESSLGPSAQNATIEVTQIIPPLCNLYSKMS